MSEQLFRLTVLRPPVAQDPQAPSVVLTQASPFQKSLGEAAKVENPRDGMVTLSAAFIKSGNFVNDVEGSDFARKVVKFCNAVDKLDASALPDLQKLPSLVKDAFGADAGQVVKDPNHQTLLSNLRDSIVAIKYVQEEHRRPIQALTDQIRDLELIQKIADTSQPAAGAPAFDLVRFRKRSLRLPLEADLRSIISSSDKRETADSGASREKIAKGLLDKHDILRKAIFELRTIDPKHLQAHPVTAHPGSVIDPSLTSVAIKTSQIKHHLSLSPLNLKQHSAVIEGGRQGTIDAGAFQDLSGGTSALNLTKTLLAPKVGLTPMNPWTPEKFGEYGIRLQSTALSTLSESTTTVLKSNGVDVVSTPLNVIVTSLRNDVSNVTTSLTELSPDYEKVTIRNIGGAYVSIKTPVESAMSKLLTGERFGGPFRPLPPLIPDGRIPHTKGKVSPAGVADLLVVRQQLKGYELVDVAHIQNVLKGESSQMDHIVTSRIDQTEFIETEVIQDEESELSSTSRFEMSKETSVTLKEDQSLKGDLKVSASYGPFIEVAASVEGSTSRSKEESTRAASKFSQDVTEKTVKRLLERSLKRSTIRTFQETVDKSSRGINNASGDKNVSGVYQFVNKVYEAQVYNYGLRTMYEFMVPEPAAFMIESMSKAADRATRLEKPPAFTLLPDDIGRSNYGWWVLKYGATDVLPPPEDFLVKTDAVNKGGGDASTDYFHSAQISIDSGYEAVQGTVSMVFNIWGDNWKNDVALGGRTHRFSNAYNSWSWSTPLRNNTGSIAWGMTTDQISKLAVTVEIHCRATDRAERAWKAETHAKLLNAYRARMQQYEEKLAALILQAGVVIEGKNPATNQIQINDELKKAAITINTNQHFELFNSIELSATTGLPQINLYQAEAEGSYVRFFEQAFEWNQLTYVNYPYFWGRKQLWQQRLSFEDPDPAFEEFLRAGFTRVVVPARVGFESAIDHFMRFGQIWNGGPLPSISGPLYLPIADEIAERARRPGSEFPQGDSWDVKVPTSLVKLRGDDKLPTWKKGSDGVWKSVEE